MKGIATHLSTKVRDPFIWLILGGAYWFAAAALNGVAIWRRDFGDWSNPRLVRG